MNTENQKELAELQPDECFFFLGTIWTILEKTQMNTKALDIVGGYRRIELMNSTLVDQV